MDGMIYPPAPQVQPLPWLNSRHGSGDGHQVASARDNKAADSESGLLRAVDQPFDLAAELFQVVHHGVYDTHAQTSRRRRPPRRSLGITSNLVFSQWEHIFANPMATAAAIDRVVHHSVILEFDVPSYRTGVPQQRGQDKEVNRQE